jgi:hypothetical protein
MASVLPPALFFRAGEHNLLTDRENSISKHVQTIYSHHNKFLAEISSQIQSSGYDPSLHHSIFPSPCEADVSRLFGFPNDYAWLKDPLHEDYLLHHAYAKEFLLQNRISCLSSTSNSIVLCVLIENPRVARLLMAYLDWSHVKHLYRHRELPDMFSPLIYAGLSRFVRSSVDKLDRKTLSVLDRFEWELLRKMQESSEGHHVVMTDDKPMVNTLCRDFQFLENLALLWFCLTQLTGDIDPTCTTHFSLHLQVFKRYQATDKFQNDFAFFKKAHVFNFTVRHSPHDIYSDLMRYFDTLLSEVLYEDVYGQEISSAYINGFSFHANSTQHPSLLLNLNQFPAQAHELMIDTLRHIQVFAPSLTSQAIIKEIEVVHPVDHVRNACLVQSLAFLSALEKIPPTMDNPKQRRVCLNSHYKGMMEYFTKHFRRDMQTNYLWQDLLTLMALLPTDALSDGVWVAFFPKAGRLPSIPSFHITRDGALILPAEGRVVFNEDEIGYRQHLIAITLGHAYVTRFDLYLEAVNSPKSSTVRTFKVDYEAEREQFQLKPIYSKDAFEKVQLQPERSLEEEARLPICARKNSPVYNKFKNVLAFTADFETGRCPHCSTPGNDIQHCYAASYAWGTTIDQQKSWYGLECPILAAKSDFMLFDGCVTQMLWFMTQNGGFFGEQGYHAPSRIITRYVYAFNGAKFDWHFLLPVLHFWSLPINFLEHEGKILSIKWGNYEFRDLALIYACMSLEKCYEILSEVDTVVHRPASGKYKCFPYGLIDQQYENKVLSIYDLAASDEIWGGKNAPNCPQGRSHAQHNSFWWQLNISGDFDLKRDLLEYCASDTGILFYCVAVHFTLSEFESNGRHCNAIDCLTGAAKARRVFRSCFLNETLVAPPFGLLPIVDPLTGQNVSLATVIRQSYFGGFTDVLAHQSHPPVDHKRWQDYLNAGGDPRYTHYVSYDVNSEYPYIMTRDQPTTFDGFEVYEEPRTMTCFVDHYLYQVSVQYPPKKCGILTRYRGACVALNTIPNRFTDPGFDKVSSIFTFVWGVELNEAIQAGATIQVFVEIRFFAEPIFREFIEYTYAKRRAATNPAVKNNLKLDMNSLYGGFGMNPRSTGLVVVNAVDLHQAMDETDQISSLEHIKGPLGRDALYAKYYPKSKPTIGNLVHIASFITAGARAYLNRLMREVQQCPDVLGRPTRICYCDTDSMYMSLPAPSSQWDAFQAKYVHDSELGKLKKEQEYLSLVFMRKKTARNVDVPDSSKKTFFKAFGKDIDLNNVPWVEHQRVYTFFDVLARPHLFHAEIKAKGIPLRNVNDTLMYDELVTSIDHPGENCIRFPMGLQFKHSLLKGTTKITTASRSMKSGNKSRQDPEADSACFPWPNLEAYIDSLNVE